jgi:hypothetical protein
VKSHPVPKVGDIVTLNRHGLELIYGTATGLDHMLNLQMMITHVDSSSMTAPESTFLVNVDNSAINKFMIDHWCFDIVKSAAPVRESRAKRIITAEDLFEKESSNRSNYSDWGGF